ncbi:hypothetical protein ARAM_005820, partial [Aspergillus rambellii]
MQDISTLISDPHVTPLGLRFPFLIVEAKAGATGGNLYQAQNQAAVDGAEASDGSGQKAAATSSKSNIVLNLAFSVTTEGPIHEFWLHFRMPEAGDFHM